MRNFKEYGLLNNRTLFFLTLYLGGVTLKYDLRDATEVTDNGGI